MRNGVLLAVMLGGSSVANPALADVDGSLPLPFTTDLHGANDAQAWLTLSTRDKARPRFDAVFDLTSGCIVETRAGFARIDDLAQLAHLSGAERMKDPSGAGAAHARRAETLMATPEVLSEISAYVAFSNRFGRTQQPGIAWSADGGTILMTPSETAFRSRDGGRTFQRIEKNMSRDPHVTRDGKWVLYERCAADVRDYSCPPASREVVIVAADDSAPARHISIGGGMIEGMDAAGETLVVVRDDVPGKLTAMHVDPVLGTMTQAFAAPAPPLPKEVFFTIDPSPGGHFGTFDFWRGWETTNRILSMTDGHTIFSFDVHGSPTVELDEEGRVAWESFPDQRVHVRVGRTAAQKDLGHGDLVGFAPGGKLLIFKEPTTGTLGQNACKMVRVASVPL